MMRARCKAVSRGLSMVEMLVGITIGLFILAGTATVATSQLKEHRQLLLDVQLQQDVRLTMDLITRDLRRAAYWGKAQTAVWPADWGTALVNPYTAMTPNDNTTAKGITFARSTDEDSGLLIKSENNTLDNAEYGGFKYVEDDQSVAVLVGKGNWQTLTDTAVMKVTQFEITVTTKTVDVPCGTDANCVGGKVLGPAKGCPLVQVLRNASIKLAAQAATDPTIRRSLSTDVHLRNDLVIESPC